MKKKRKKKSCFVCFIHRWVVSFSSLNLTYSFLINWYYSVLYILQGRERKMFLSDIRLFYTRSSLINFPDTKKHLHLWSWFLDFMSHHEYSYSYLLFHRINNFNKPSFSQSITTICLWWCHQHNCSCIGQSNIFIKCKWFLDSLRYWYINESTMFQSKSNFSYEKSLLFL